MRGNRPPLLLPEETALAAAFPGARTLGGPAPPPGPRRENREGGEAAGLTRGAEAEAGGDGRVFCELQSDNNQ